MDSGGNSVFTSGNARVLGSGRIVSICLDVMFSFQTCLFIRIIPRSDSGSHLRMCITLSRLKVAVVRVLSSSSLGQPATDSRTQALHYNAADRQANALHRFPSSRATLSYQAASCIITTTGRVSSGSSAALRRAVRLLVETSLLPHRQELTRMQTSPLPISLLFLVKIYLLFPSLYFHS